MMDAVEVVDVVLVPRAHAAAWTRHLASALAGDEVQVGRHCPTCGSGEHGRPVVRRRPDVHLSLAYSEPWAVVALARVDVGVDVEPAGAVDEVALRAVGIAAGADPTSDWVAHEAATKLAGTGLREGAPPAVVQHVHGPHGLVVAVATRALADVRLREEAGAPGDAATA